MHGPGQDTRGGASSRYIHVAVVPRTIRDTGVSGNGVTTLKKKTFGTRTTPSNLAIFTLSQLICEHECPPRPSSLKVWGAKRGPGTSRHSNPHSPRCKLHVFLERSVASNTRGRSRGAQAPKPLMRRALPSKTWFPNASESPPVPEPKSLVRVISD